MMFTIFTVLYYMQYVMLFQYPSSERFFVKVGCNTILLTYKELPYLVQSCELPVIVCSEGRLIISGLCSVLRHIVHIAQQDAEYLDSDDLANCLKNLLGLRQNCLRACAEVSEWTLYTEVILPQLLERLLNNCDIIGSDPPAELLQLENQLAKLPIEPNCHRNKKQSKAGKSSDTPTAIKESIVEYRRNENFSESLKHSKCKNILEESDNLQVAKNAEEMYQRPFVEGNSVQLTDLILFICIRLLFDITDTEQWCLHLPRLVSWSQRMAAIPSVNNAVISAGLFECVAHSITQGSEISHLFPLLSTASISDKSSTSVEDEHGFFCTSGGSKSTLESDDQSSIQNTHKTKFRASQALINAGIAKVTKMALQLEVLPLGNGSCLQLPWEQYPSWVVPYGLGGVPDKRAARKLQQLENIAAAVKELVSERVTGSESHIIVDFCSGGGHVGILLAYLFSHCKVGNF